MKPTPIDEQMGNGRDDNENDRERMGWELPNDWGEDGHSDPEVNPVPGRFEAGAHLMIGYRNGVSNASKPVANQRTLTERRVCPESVDRLEARRIRGVMG